MFPEIWGSQGRIAATHNNKVACNHSCPVVKTARIAQTCFEMIVRAKKLQGRGRCHNFQNRGGHQAFSRIVFHYGSSVGGISNAY